MFSRTVRLASVAVFCLGLGILSSGCNVDGLWADRQGPKGPVTSATHPRGAGAAGKAVDITVADAQEVDLVEKVILHRALYHRTLGQLRDHYEAHGDAAKLGWAEFELKGVRKVKPFRYLLDSEIPSDSLKPVEQIAEADALYERGLELMRGGGHGVPGLYREDLMIEAARVFRDLIERYPTSDKIDDAAFYEGEIHKEYLPGQETIAVKWYERAWTWNPDTPHPARFQAAVTYDYRLHDRDRALELYQSVIKHETAIKSNVRFATNRIHQLTTDERTAHADAQ